jgi:hypothetical protein
MLAQGKEIEEYINFESLPLMRRLFFWSFVLATFLLMAFTTQICFYLWLIAGLIGMWHAFIPVLLVFLILQLYLVLVKTLSLSTCCCFVLSFVGLLLYAAKCKEELHLNWIVTVIPIAVVEIIFLIHLVWITVQSVRAIFILTRRQIICVTGFLVSFLLALVAEGITVTRDCPAASFPLFFQMSENTVQILPLKIWVIAGSLFTVSALTVVQKELDRIAHSRGYTDPMPLTRSQLGWEPMAGYREVTSILIGVIQIAPPRISNSRYD